MIVNPLHTVGTGLHMSLKHFFTYKIDSSKVFMLTTLNIQTVLTYRLKIKIYFCQTFTAFYDNFYSNCDILPPVKFNTSLYNHVKSICNQDHLFTFQRGIFKHLKYHVIALFLFVMHFIYSH